MKSIVIYAFVVVAQEDNFLLFMRAPVAKVNCIASTVGLCVSRLQSHRRSDQLPTKSSYENISKCNEMLISSVSAFPPAHVQHSRC